MQSSYTKGMMTTNCQLIVKNLPNGDDLKIFDVDIDPTKIKELVLIGEKSFKKNDILKDLHIDVDNQRMLKSQPIETNTIPGKDLEYQIQLPSSSIDRGSFFEVHLVAVLGPEPAYLKGPYSEPKKTDFDSSPCYGCVVLPRVLATVDQDEPKKGFIRGSISIKSEENDKIFNIGFKAPNYEFLGVSEFRVMFDIYCSVVGKFYRLFSDPILIIEKS